MRRELAGGTMAFPPSVAEVELDVLATLELELPPAIDLSAFLIKAFLLDSALSGLDGEEAPEAMLF